MRISADQQAHIAWPEILHAQLRRWRNPEHIFEHPLIRDALVVTAHLPLPFSTPADKSTIEWFWPPGLYTEHMHSIEQEPPAAGLTDHLTCSVPHLLGPSGLSAWALQSTGRAGFPSPAEDFQAKRIDILERLVKHP